MTRASHHMRMNETSVAHPGVCSTTLKCLVLVLAGYSAPQFLSAAPEDPSSVVIIVNDGTPPEAGTGGMGASQYVGLYYAEARNIPLSNILHVNIPMTDPHSRSSWYISMDDFEGKIRVPLRHFLSGRRGRAYQYIVPTYGVPTHFAYPGPGSILGASVDSFLATTMLSGKEPNTLFLPNPIFNPDPQSTPTVEQLSAGKIHFVSRLDGPSALLATGLVDKALEGERGISRHSGVGYFDYQHRNDRLDPYFPSDQTMVNAYNLCVHENMNCVLNDQSATRTLIYSAPNTLWAWGWYNLALHYGYSFAPGAVGAQLTSYTANTIRGIEFGTWVPLWVSQGITATWGATDEPLAEPYTKGDNLLQHLWNGYSFGQAAYLATEWLNWMMIFVGDPLYKPVFVD